MTPTTDGTITAQDIRLSSRLRVSPEVVLQETGDEAVLLDMASEHYFGLNAVATRIWKLMEAGKDLRAVRDELLAVYDVDVGEVERDVFELAGQLVDAGLVHIE